MNVSHVLKDIIGGSKSYIKKLRLGLVGREAKEKDLEVKARQLVWAT